MAGYDEVAADYEELVVPRYRPVAEHLARVAAVRDGERVLEVGAGTGTLTRLLGGDPTATDVSLPMLVRAGAGRAALADTVALPFRDGCFDLVVASLAPLPDSTVALAEARRVLRPGGRVCFAMFAAGFSEMALVDAARETTGEPPTPKTAVPDALRRLAGLGMEFNVDEKIFPVRYGSSDAYLRFRRSFGRPRGWTPQHHAAFLEKLAELTDRDGPVDLDWRVAFVTAYR